MEIDPDKFKKYFECDCGTHLISLSKDMECGETYMSFWSYGHGGNKGIKNKLRHIWRILKRGEPYADSVCFSYEEFIRLRDFVNEIALWKATEST